MIKIKHALLIFFIAVLGIFQTEGETLDDIFSQRGYVDVSTLNPDIMVDLMYSKADNFTGVVLYENLDKAWLHKDAAVAVDKAQKELSSLMPGYHLLIKDAARPMSVQRHMFNTVKGTPKANYVANPANGGGLHNYGVAVDITIADAEGRELDMGTPVDHLGIEANIDRESELVKSGIMSENARQNRLLLRRVMKTAGFNTIRTEWWHFDLVPKKRAKEIYKMLDF